MEKTAEKIIEDLKKLPEVQKALEEVGKELHRAVEDQKELVLIEAPTGNEARRAIRYAEMLEEAGLEDVKVTSENNVYGYLRGSGNTGSCVLLEGHLDTVFSFGDVKDVQTDEEGRIHCPGICDDTRALAANLNVLRALKAAGICPVHDIVFAGTVAEEGLGGMRGMAALLDTLAKEKKILGTISVDGPTATHFYANATGMTDWNVIYEGPGGHAWLKYGTPSALHAASRAVAKCADLELPAEPKTTQTVSLIEGGQAIHGIAQKASFKVNARSNSALEMEKLNGKLIKIFEQAAEEENRRWHSLGAIQVRIEKILDVPAGSQPRKAPIIQLTEAATRGIGLEPLFKPGGCTNANMAIDRKIPAVTVGRGGNEFGTHTLDEWFDPKGVEACEKKSVLMLLAMAGVTGGTMPFPLT